MMLVRIALFVFITISCAMPIGLHAGTLMLQPANPDCDVQARIRTDLPSTAKQRLGQSQPMPGTRDIAWTWFGSPTSRYPHSALGSKEHAASLHVLPGNGQLQEQTYMLPLNRVFEDRVPRLFDLDGDGRDEVVVVEADALRGAALVVFGLRNGAIVELARGPFAGGSFRWLNPVGVADFDGDGRLDLASVTTPHIGGVLTLYHYRPPRLEPYARYTDVSNHRMGEVEQQMAVIVMRSGQRPAILIPDMQLSSVRALRWDHPGRWTEIAHTPLLPARVERLTPIDGGACQRLADGRWWRVMLSE